jgi:hypothetical protein
VLHLLCLFYQFLFFQSIVSFQTLENSFLLLTDDRCSLLEHISLSGSEELDTVFLFVVMDCWVCVRQECLPQVMH